MKCHCCPKDYKINLNAYECPSCGHFYLPYSGDIYEFYKNTYRKDNPLFSKEVRLRHANNIVNAITPFLSTEQDITEYGAGDGALLNLLKAKGYNNIFGVDIDYEMVKIMSQNDIVADCGNATEDVYETDVLMAFDLLEHTEHIDEVIRLWAAESKYLVIQVPAKRRKKFQFKGHFHVFTEKSYRLLLEQVGEIVFFSTGGDKEYSMGPAHLAIVKTNNV